MVAEMLHINDISIFDGRLSYIKPAMLLLNVLVRCKSSDNTVAIYKSDMVQAVSDNHRTVAPRTVQWWLERLAKNGAIKFRAERHNVKAPALIIINPYYIFDGLSKDYAAVLEHWREFESDVEAVSADYVAV